MKSLLSIFLLLLPFLYTDNNDPITIYGEPLVFKKNVAGVREWTCKNGHVLDRDLNAAKNILKEGLKIISSGTGDYTDGDGVRSGNTQLSVKSEAQPIASGVGG